MCWVWRNLASCWASLPSLSIQTFGLGGRHIDQTLVQTLAEIPTLAFLVTGQVSCPWGERRVLSTHYSSALNALPHILGAEGGRKSERRKSGISTLFPLPHLVADYSRIDHTLEASSGTGTMTWGCLGLKGTSGNVETRISQGSSGIILGGGNRQTGSQ